jgi:hypothetical protein
VTEAEFNALNHSCPRRDMTMGHPKV